VNKFAATQDIRNLKIDVTILLNYYSLKESFAVIKLWTII